MIAEMDSLMQLTLPSLIEEVSAPHWTGRREREVVSLFCFGHLLHQCRPGTFLHHPTQIGVEVAVPQVPGQTALSKKATSKGQVCKDIVIWPQPRMTCWNAAGEATVRPVSIIEWKHNQSKVSVIDVKWLTEFSTGSADFVGYAVCTNRPNVRGFRLSCTRVFRGQVQPRWLFIE